MEASCNIQTQDYHCWENLRTFTGFCNLNHAAWPLPDCRTPSVQLRVYKDFGLNDLRCASWRCSIPSVGHNGLSGITRIHSRICANIFKIQNESCVALARSKQGDIIQNKLVYITQIFMFPSKPPMGLLWFGMRAQKYACVPLHAKGVNYACLQARTCALLCA